MQPAEKEHLNPLAHAKDFMLAGSEKNEDMMGMRYLSQQNGAGVALGNPDQESFSFSKWMPFGNPNPNTGEDVDADSWYQKWFKWYYIIPGILVFCYVIMLSESVADSRRTRKDKKEGMQHNQSNLMEDDAKVRGILKLQRKAERKYEAKKNVSFKMEEMKQNIWLFTGSSESIHGYFWNLLKWMIGSLASFFIRIYDLWILPGVYLISRSI